jgi:hypothetical protein
MLTWIHSFAQTQKESAQSLEPWTRLVVSLNSKVSFR